MKTARETPPDERRFREQVGVRIARLRAGRAISQTAAARAIGVSQPALHNYETGRRELPLYRALLLAALYDVDLAAIATPSDVGEGVEV